MAEVQVTCPHCGKQHPVDLDALKAAKAKSQPALFEEAPPKKMRKTVSAEDAKKRAFVMEFDGGSRGNPGPAGVGVRLITEDGVELYELGEFIGNVTNNVAEYTGLIRGLSAAIAWKAAKLTIRADSELVVRQINGQYKVKSPDLKPLYEKAIRLMDQIPEVKVFHVYRENNKRCDQLANEAMDKKGKIEPVGPLPD